MGSMPSKVSSAMLGPTFIFLALGAFISVEAARVRRETKKCPPENCKTEKDKVVGSFLCPWKEREIDKGVFGEHFGHLMRTTYACKKDGMDGICCPAERTGQKSGECLSDETVIKKVRDSQCDEEFPDGSGWCSSRSEELLGKCVQCKINTDCEARRPYCMEGTCVECEDHRHCAAAHTLHDHCHLGVCSRHMRCEGFYYKAIDNGHVAGPELVIKFNNPKSEAHLHYPSPINQKEIVLPTRPETVNFPYRRGNNDKTPEKLKNWDKLTAKCKESVEVSGQRWTPGSFFHIRSDTQRGSKPVDAHFKGSIPKGT